jgi:hypothetical protein
MKYEQAIQQVMSEYNRHTVDDDGVSIVSDLDGYGECECLLDDLKHAIRNGNNSDRRKAAKELAAMSLRFMVDRT